ncbi:sirohydrochlorin chelatase [Chromohalobacter canadensis]|uniref:CbiX/SirB N-terminal domain-containing protein n=1 Tax=Chromohalobacter canadensis TaxID=141389 RepID=A0ABZ0Y7R1_9GAMM|nr:CbiX/SirB N-terminal domain-containing protein [Chromohalobacter canadensis]MCK0769894.1 CbiX/SirB N-terminal domain-containing protein [Chromohalobacter canadensis]WQH07743.1 CbiX/SirB N-terminal domain-containing protein [Chromohalobacter canadensis]
MSHALILLAHGSSDARWRAPFETLEHDLRARLETPAVIAYMELSEPSLETRVAELYDQGHRRLDILPLFFAAGRHLRQDVPAQLEALREQYPQAALTLLDPVGQHPAFVEALAGIVTSRVEASLER